MASSTGVVVTATDMLGMTPPEVLRYLVLRSNPNKHIDFDPGMGLLALVDEYDRLERLYYGHEDGVDPQDQRRAFELSQISRDVASAMREEAGLDGDLNIGEGGPGPEPVQVAYKNMVTLTQIAPGWEGVKGLLERQGTLGPDTFAGEGGAAMEERLRSRLEAVGFWLENFAPDMVKFSLAKQMPEGVKEGLDEVKKGWAASLKEALSGVEWKPDTIHTTIHETAVALGVKAPKVFQLLYQLFLGQKKGPRLGYFLASLEKEFVLGRLGEAAM
jgi:lysyl-tRNA synthetase class 1